MKTTLILNIQKNAYVISTNNLLEITSFDFSFTKVKQEKRYLLSLSTKSDIEDLVFLVNVDYKEIIVIHYQELNNYLLELTPMIDKDVDIYGTITNLLQIYHFANKFKITKELYRLIKTSNKNQIIKFSSLTDLYN